MGFTRELREFAEDIKDALDEINEKIEPVLSGAKRVIDLLPPNPAFEPARRLAEDLPNDWGSVHEPWYLHSEEAVDGTIDLDAVWKLNEELCQIDLTAQEVAVARLGQGGDWSSANSDRYQELAARAPMQLARLVETSKEACRLMEDFANDYEDYLDDIWGELNSLGSIIFDVLGILASLPLKLTLWTISLLLYDLGRLIEAAGDLWGQIGPTREKGNTARTEIVHRLRDENARFRAQGQWPNVPSMATDAW
ncbi:hypothetical protein [Tessaracoccus massiliensis]|uniref:hypothetical protein n=1 Tax=Tessaracoccus massiliensis TaxID=1522311 RepID=UPI000590B06B|nr:hypothetical protein [Tessaracoccus massiliensis]